MPDTIDHHTLPYTKPFQILHLPQENDVDYLQPHRHEYYEIVWVLSGEGHQNIDFIEYPMQSGQVFTLAPGQVHAGPFGCNHIVLLTFNPGFFDSDYRSQLVLGQLFYPGQSVGSRIEVDAEGTQHLLHLCEIMAYEQSSPHPDWDLQAALLNSFLRYLSRYCIKNDNSSSVPDGRTIELFILIDQHFRQQKTAFFYAERLSLTRKRVNELTRQSVGKTITRLLHDRIILEARRELAFSRKPVKIIAHELGFDDATYFCRFFRRLTGESPMYFRQRTFR